MGEMAASQEAELDWEVGTEAEDDWEEVMKVRNAGTEVMSKKEVDRMTKYEEKIGMKEMFSKHGVPQPELFLSLRPPWSSEQLEAAIRAGVAAVGQVVVTQKNSCFMRLRDLSMFVGDVVVRQKYSFFCLKM